jgi:hypothetical protein
MATDKSVVQEAGVGVGESRVLEAGQLLEGVARKIRRHKGVFSNLEFLVIRLHIEAALDLIPKPLRPGPDEQGDGANDGAAKVRTTRTLAGHRPARA